MQNLLEEGKTDAQGMPLPGDVDAALKQIGQRIKRLRILDVQFEDKHPEVASKAQDIAQATELQKDAQDADYEEIDPFDNP